MTIHELKTWPEPFTAVWNGTKPYEVRRDDRGFSVGDTLVLREWVPDPLDTTWGRMHSSQDHSACVCRDWGKYTNREVHASVTYKTEGGSWGLPEGLCVLGLNVFKLVEPWRKIEPLYYVQDTRSVVGDCALWWRENGAGYTCDLDAAGLYRKDYHTWCDTDRLWLREDVERLPKRHVRIEDLQRLAGFRLEDPVVLRGGQGEETHDDE